MHGDQEPTLGEVYRACLRIEKQVTLTNGRVTKAEARITRLETISGIVGAALSAAFGWLISK